MPSTARFGSLWAYLVRTEYPLAQYCLPLFMLLQSFHSHAAKLECHSLLAIHLLPRSLLCLDVLVTREADIIREIRYLARLMRQNCQEASWRMDLLLSKLKEEESLNTQITSIQVDEARNELQLIMRGIEGIEKLCELESEDND